MMLRNFAMLSAATLALAACGGNKQAADNGATADSSNMAVGNDTAAASPAASPAQSFVDGAAAGDAFEIASSELAASNAQSAKVKTFAKQMITAHTESTAKLKTAAASARPAIIADATLTAEQQQKLEALKTKTGAAFDQAYVADQRAAHEATLASLQDYAATGAVPELKAFASSLVPTVTAHLNVANGLKP